MSAGSMQIECAVATDSGMDPQKRVNEDACGYARTGLGHLLVVCDGMGGHAGGKQASDLAIRTLINHVEEASATEDPRRVLVAAIEQAARKVYQLGGPAANQQRPGSTCVALLLHDGCAEIAHVGDSRAYAIRGQQIYQLTRDHSMVQEMIDGGLLSEIEAIGHPDSNKITRALGMAPEAEVELRAEPLDLFADDVLLLCTDGLTDLARPDDILITVGTYLRNGDVQSTCNELVALANRRGGYDNITVQIARVQRVGQRTTSTRVQEPGSVALGAGPGAGRPVPTTLEGSPAPALAAVRTLIQSPAGKTDPGPPPDIALDRGGPAIGTLPGGSTPGRSGPRPLAPGAPVMPDEDDDRHRRLVTLVVALVGVIGLLVALLVWALWIRE